MKGYICWVHLVSSTAQSQLEYSYMYPINNGSIAQQTILMREKFLTWTLSRNRICAVEFFCTQSTDRQWSLAWVLVVVWPFHVCSGSTRICTYNRCLKHTLCNSVPIQSVLGLASWGTTQLGQVLCSHKGVPLPSKLNSQSFPSEFIFLWAVDFSPCLALHVLRLLAAWYSLGLHRTLGGRWDGHPDFPGNLETPYHLSLKLIDFH